MFSKKLAAAAVALSGAASLLFAQPAGAIPWPGTHVDCSGALGDTGAHRYTVTHNVISRVYNTTGAQQNGYFLAHSKIHIFYEKFDENGASMWAVQSGGLCGYVYRTDIIWNQTW